MTEKITTKNCERKTLRKESKLSEEWSVGELVFDPMTAEFVQDPYAFYSRFRERAPVYRTPQGPWFVTRFEDVAFVVRDRRFGRDFGRAQASYHGPDWATENSLQMLSRMILFLDPPDHSRIRSL